MINSVQSKQISELLKDTSDDVVSRVIDKFTSLIKDTGEVYILFGAGPLGKYTLSNLRRIGIEPLGFADNNSTLWGKIIEGLPVYSPMDAAVQFKEKAIFIITVYTNQPVIKQLQKQGVKFTTFALLAWYYSEAMLSYEALDLPNKIFAQAEDVQKVFHLWADDISRSEYLGQVLWRTSLDRSVLPPHLAQNEIYFADDLIVPLADEVFVDCGAFDGDSVQEYLNHRADSFSQIIAIEPDPANYKVLETRVASLPIEMAGRIQVLQSAVGLKREIVTFNATGTAGSSIGESDYEVQCVPLNDILKDIAPTFIKMDIEGAEYQAIDGGRDTIGKHLPVLAICLYHHQEDLWRIPLLIHSISNQYQLFLRRYSDECWELVCYAVPPARFLSGKPAG